MPLTVDYLHVDVKHPSREMWMWWHGLARVHRT